MRRIILKENLTPQQIQSIPDLDKELKMVLLNCPTYNQQYTPIKLNGKWVLKKVVAGKGYIVLNSDYSYDKYETANPENETGKLLPRPQSGNRWRPCDAAIKTTSLEVSPNIQSIIDNLKETRPDLKTVDEIGGIGAAKSGKYQEIDIWTFDNSIERGKFFLYKEKGMGGIQKNSTELVRSWLGSAWTLDDTGGLEMFNLKTVLDGIPMSRQRRVQIEQGIAGLKNIDTGNQTAIDKIPVYKNTAKVDLSKLDPELQTFLETIESNADSSDFQKKFCVKAIKKLNYYNKAGENAASIVSAIPQSTIEAWKQFAYACSTVDRGYYFRFVKDDIDELRVSNGNLSLKPLFKSARAVRTVQESVDSRIKSIVRNNLLMLSESKKKSVINEKQIVRTKFRPILESKLNKKVKIDRLINETFYLINNGVDKKVVTESFWDLAKGFVGYGGSGLISYVKEKIVDSIIDKFVPGGSETWLGGIVSKSLSDIPLGDIINGNAFSCEYLTESLAKGISEEAVDKFQNKIGASGGFFDVIRNSLIEVIDDTTFFQRLKDGISTILCPTINGLKDGLGKVVTSSGLKDDITSTLTKATN